MTPKQARLVAASFAALLALPLTSSAQVDELQLAERSGSQIRRPTVITRPGTYVLARDLGSGAGTAIEIRASGVTLDLGGRRISGPGDRRGEGIAVVGATNVKITNGFLEGLGIGVRLENTTNVVVEGLQIDGNDLGGPPPEVEIGILLLDARGSVIQHNTITETFLGIFVRGERSSGNRLVENVITGGANGELAICYNPLAGQAPGGPDGDLIYGNHIARFRRGLSFATGSVGNIVRENFVAYFDLAVEEGTAGDNQIEDNHATQIPR